MPRKYKLTWQPGSGNRPGRWRKKYKGKCHYFSSGRGKSDREAYDAALAAWERKKVEIDAALPKRHQADYGRAIREWQSVLTWCRKHPGDERMADTQQFPVNGKGICVAGKIAASTAGVS